MEVKEREREIHIKITYVLCVLLHPDIWLALAHRQRTEQTFFSQEVMVSNKCVHTDVNTRVSSH